MKVCIAQTRPVKGNVSANITAHKKLIALAVTNGAEAIFFPELSITGYEPKLAKDLAVHKDDERLDEFQHLSDNNGITIGIGVPTISENGIQISMICFSLIDKDRLIQSNSFILMSFPTLSRGKNNLFLPLTIIRLHQLYVMKVCSQPMLKKHLDLVHKFMLPV